jgi:hypothetical protein
MPSPIFSSGPRTGTRCICQVQCDSGVAVAVQSRRPIDATRFGSLLHFLLRISQPQPSLSLTLFRLQCLSRYSHERTRYHTSLLTGHERRHEAIATAAKLEAPQNHTLTIRDRKAPSRIASRETMSPKRASDDDLQPFNKAQRIEQQGTDFSVSVKRK